MHVISTLSAVEYPGVFATLIRFSVVPNSSFPFSFLPSFRESRLSLISSPLLFSFPPTNRIRIHPISPPSVPHLGDQELSSFLPPLLSQRHRSNSIFLLHSAKPFGIAISSTGKEGPIYTPGWLISLSLPHVSHAFSLFPSLSTLSSLSLVFVRPLHTVAGYSRAKW